MKKFIPSSPAAIFLTVLLIGIGGYLTYEHRKKEGFWWGALAALLVLSIIVISQLDIPSSTPMAAAPAMAPPAAPMAPAPKVDISVPAPVI